MKKLILVLVVLITSVSAQAQNPVAKGQAQLNAGLGFSGWGIPIYAGLDYGVHKDVTIGGEVAFRSYSNHWHGNKYDHSIFSMLFNTNYHFNHLLEIPTNWDFYAGANIGFYMWNSHNDYDGDGSSGLGLGLQVGGRYYFNDKFGLNLEFGGGNVVSNGKIGISIKL